jgi:hypothetical protein
VRRIRRNRNHVALAQAVNFSSLYADGARLAGRTTCALISFLPVTKSRLAIDHAVFVNVRPAGA